MRLMRAPIVALACAVTLSSGPVAARVRTPLPPTTGPASPAQASPADTLERVVIVMRHGVRSAMSSPAELGRYSRRPWPAFAVPPGNLTANGAVLVTMLGDWYRRNYQALGLLGTADCAVYYQANHTQRTEATATALAAGLTPRCPTAIHQTPAAPDPLFEAPLTPLAPLDSPRILAAISGRVGGDLGAWDVQQRAGLDRFEALMLQCRRPVCDATERRGIARLLRDTPVRLAIGPDHKLEITSPALQVAGIAESLMMAYADGLVFKGWRGIDATTIGEAMTVHAAGIDLRTRTPEVGRQTSSYLAMRLLATIQRGAGVPVLAEPIGDAEKILVLSGHDGTVTMLAGLLGLDWQLPGYGANQAVPGGGLVFELWRRAADGRQVVRVRYVAQGLDQMRFRTPLAATAGPLSAPVAVPGCVDADLGCPLTGFTAHLLAAVQGE